MNIPRSAALGAFECAAQHCWQQAGSKLDIAGSKLAASWTALLAERFRAIEKYLEQ